MQIPVIFIFVTLFLGADTSPPIGVDATNENTGNENSTVMDLETRTEGNITATGEPPNTETTIGLTPSHTTTSTGNIENARDLNSTLSQPKDETHTEQVEMDSIKTEEYMGSDKTTVGGTESKMATASGFIQTNDTTTDEIVNFNTTAQPSSMYGEAHNETSPPVIEESLIFNAKTPALEMTSATESQGPETTTEYRINNIQSASTVTAAVEEFPDFNTTLSQMETSTQDNINTIKVVETIEIGTETSPTTTSAATHALEENEVTSTSTNSAVTTANHYTTEEIKTPEQNPESTWQPTHTYTKEFNDSLHSNTAISNPSTTHSKFITKEENILQITATHGGRNETENLSDDSHSTNTIPMPDTAFTPQKITETKTKYTTGTTQRMPSSTRSSTSEKTQTNVENDKGHRSTERVYTTSSNQTKEHTPQPQIPTRHSKESKAETNTNISASIIFITLLLIGLLFQTT